MATDTLSPEERAAKRREYHRQYRLANAERLLANRREWRKRNKHRVHGYYEKNKEYILDRNRQWARANPEKARAYSRRYSQTHPEERSNSLRRYYELNKGAILARQRQWGQDNPATVRAMQRKWCADNPEKVRTKFQRWVKNNPEAYRAALQRYKDKDPTAYRAYKRTQQQIREARKLQQMPQWVVCEELLEIYNACPPGMHVDHIVPLRGVTADGYRVSGLHLPWNLAYLPASENREKYNRMRPEDHVAAEAPVEGPRQLRLFDD